MPDSSIDPMAHELARQLVLNFFPEASSFQAGFTRMYGKQIADGVGPALAELRALIESASDSVTPPSSTNNVTAFRAAG
jgi:hypothetical protein